MVITTAMIPGKPAPKLITREMVEAMKPGGAELTREIPFASRMGWAMSRFERRCVTRCLATHIFFFA